MSCCLRSSLQIDGFIAVLVMMTTSADLANARLVSGEKPLSLAAPETNVKVVSSAGGNFGIVIKWSF